MKLISTIFLKIFIMVSLGILIPSNSVLAQTVPNNAVHTNQMGYFNEGAKHATVATDTGAPQIWTLIAGNGTTALQGSTTSYGRDEGSGINVQQIDFSNYRGIGTGYTLQVGSMRSHPFDISENPYGNLLYDAFRYYYYNRSSVPLESPYVAEAQWVRPAGPADNNVPCWPNSGCNYRLDVSNGWYDAADYGKYVSNSGSVVWQLMNLYERGLYVDSNLLTQFADNTMNIPESGNGVSDLLDEIRFNLEFMLGMQVPNGQPLAGMAHHKMHNDEWHTVGTRPADMGSANRYLTPPTTIATLYLAGAAAQCARIWETIDPGFSAQCLSAAERAWQAARANPAVTHPDDPYNNGGGPYNNLASGTEVDDEFYWASVELFITTGNSIYRDFLLRSPNYQATSSNTISSYNITMIAHMSLSLVPNNLSSSQLQSIRNLIIDVANGSISIIDSTGFGTSLSGTNFYWGSNGQVLNDLMIIGAAYDITGDNRYRMAMQEGIDYIFGRNALGLSYVTGYGEQAIRNPTHSWYANSANSAFPTIPPGFLTGGPNSIPADPTAIEALAGCIGMTCYIDSILSYSTNEIAININSPLLWVASFLLADRAVQPPPATPTPIIPTSTPTPTVPPSTPNPTPTAVVTSPPSTPMTAQSIEALNAPNIDGVVDAQWSAAPQYRMQNSISDDGTVSANDLSGTFRLMNDSTYLYILVEVTDDLQQNDSGAEWWQDDAIEIYIDGDHSRRSTYDGANDYQLGFRWNDPTVRSGVNSASIPTGVQQRMANSSNGYHLEVAIPLAQVGIVFGTDTRFGLDIQVNDDDDGGFRETKLAWHTSVDESWFNPSLFGTGQLANMTPQGPSGTAAQSTRSNVAPQIDGAIDAQWSAAQQYRLTNVIIGDSVVASDLSGAFRLLNDDTNLYLLVEVTDDLQQNDSGNEWWQDDTIEIYIDGDLSRRSTYDGLNDYQLGFRWNDPNVMSGVNSASVPAGLRQRMVSTGNGYRLEVAIPLAQVGILPSNNIRFGLDVQLIDDDNGSLRETKLAWYSQVDETWADPSLFGTGELSILAGLGLSENRVYLALIQK